MANISILKGVKVGDRITARLLNGITDAINKNTNSIAAPRTKKNNNSTEVEAAGLTDLTFNSTSVTESTQTATDSNGDTVDIERVDSIVFENSSGNVLTLNITYS
jgi:hypothetical protein